MTQDQTIILCILGFSAGMFLWGKWRHDMVALAALILCVMAGLVPATGAFAGFGHPAVITVACVLVLSRSLLASGAVDVVSDRLLPDAAGPTAIAALTGLAAVLSAFMNNVGALALLMPVALQIAVRQKLPAGKVLMPLAFGSILGGMTTLIGTPPNLVVSSFRAEAFGSGFAMFAYTPVGLVVAASGVLFVAMVGWRLVPGRTGAGNEEFDAGQYVTEARIEDDTKAVGMTLSAIEGELEQADAQVIGLIRNEVRLTAPNPRRVVKAGDILVIEADPKALAAALSLLGLKLEEAVVSKEPPAPEKAKPAKKAARHEPARRSKAKKPETPAPSDEIELRELAIMPNSQLAGMSADRLQLRTSFGINLLAISRQGMRSRQRLRSTRLKEGDVLLVQGPGEAISLFADDFGCVPLAQRALRLPDKRQAIVASAIMAATIAVAAFGLLPADVAFAAGVLTTMALRVIPLREVYSVIDWPVIVLLGALIPVAGAMATTGAADLLAQELLQGIAQGYAVVALVLILVVTMTLSDFMNNAATAAIMCPIAIATAKTMGANADPFLMAVAVGASCAFLTPIGHQNNTLILGPGGFKFGDYWRLGLPVEVIVVLVSIPMILLVWPL